jgi:hypothetical protein
MTQDERRNMVALAVEEAARRQTTEGLTEVYRITIQKLDEIQSTVRAIETELMRRWKEEIPAGTEVLISRPATVDVTAFIRSVHSIGDDGQPLWTLWKAKRDGTQSKFRMSQLFRTEQFAVKIKLGTRP